MCVFRFIGDYNGYFSAGLMGRNYITMHTCAAGRVNAHPINTKTHNDKTLLYEKQISFFIIHIYG